MRHPGLVAKKIMVRSKGGVHKRTYWVKPEEAAGLARLAQQRAVAKLPAGAKEAYQRLVDKGPDGKILVFDKKSASGISKDQAKALVDAGIADYHRDGYTSDAFTPPRYIEFTTVKLKQAPPMTTDKPVQRRVTAPGSDLPERNIQNIAQKVKVGGLKLEIWQANDGTWTTLGPHGMPLAQGGKTAAHTLAMAEKRLEEGGGYPGFKAYRAGAKDTAKTDTSETYHDPENTTRAYLRKKYGKTSRF